MTVIGPRPSGRLDEEGLARGQPFEYEFERLTIAAVLPALAALGFGLAPARPSGAVSQREES